MHEHELRTASSPARRAPVRARARVTCTKSQEPYECGLLLLCLDRPLLLLLRMRMRGATLAHVRAVCGLRGVVCRVRHARVRRVRVSLTSHGWREPTSLVSRRQPVSRGALAATPPPPLAANPFARLNCAVALCGATPAKNPRPWGTDMQHCLQCEPSQSSTPTHNPHQPHWPTGLPVAPLTAAPLKKTSKLIVFAFCPREEIVVKIVHACPPAAALSVLPHQWLDRVVTQARQLRLEFFRVCASGRVKGHSDGGVRRRKDARLRHMMWSPAVGEAGLGAGCVSVRPGLQGD